jgi:hypothetical protein
MVVVVVTGRDRPAEQDGQRLCRMVCGHSAHQSAHHSGVQPRERGLSDGLHASLPLQTEKNKNERKNKNKNSKKGLKQPLSFSFSKHEEFISVKNEEKWRISVVILYTKLFQASHIIEDAGLLNATAGRGQGRCSPAVRRP